MTPPPLLSLQRLCRTLAGRSIVRDLDLSLDRGEVLGLLGVNGAGKSTTLCMIAGVLAPSAGAVRIDGEDLHENPRLARSRIGYLPEIPPLHDELTVGEYLAFAARLHGIARAGIAGALDRAIERCDLGDVRRRLIGALSKGFRQRVGLAQAILHEPDLVVLDEPAAGLDPVQALHLRRIVREIGILHGVIVSTHLLPDVIACCDRVAILHEGALRHSGAVADAAEDVALRIDLASPCRREDLAALAPVASADAPESDARPAKTWRIRLRPGASAADLATAIVARGYGLESLRAERAGIEEIFLSIAAGGAKAAAA